MALKAAMKALRALKLNRLSQSSSIKTEPPSSNNRMRRVADQKTSSRELPPADSHTIVPSRTPGLSRLETLPQEVFKQICQYLSLPSARNLSRCSTLLYHALFPYVLGPIELDMRSSIMLENELRFWDDLLGRRNAYHLIKHVKVVSCDDMTDPTPGMSSSIAAASHPSQEKWQSILDLLNKLPAIQTFDLSGLGELHDGLLEFMREERPRCRLLVRDLLMNDKLDSHMNIMTSLSRLNVEALYMQLKRTQSIDLDQEFLTRLLSAIIRGPARTKLKHVELRILKSWTSAGLWTDDTFDPLREYLVASKKRKELPSLAIHQQQLRSDDFTQPSLVLTNLTELFDLTYLCRLCLGGFLSPDLRWAAKHIKFPSLQDLELQANLDEEDQRLWLGYSFGVYLFLRSLPALRSLKLHRIDIQENLMFVLGHHVASLKMFSIFLSRQPSSDQPCHKVLTPAQISQLAQRCPQLESFQGEVDRDYNNPKETAIYHSFAQFRNLQEVTLHINCSLQSPNFHESGLVQKVKNAVFDAELARAVWHAISTKKHGRPLEQLRLFPFYQYFSNYIYRAAPRPRGSLSPAKPGLASLCRSYELIRTLNFDRTSGVYLRQVFHPDDVDSALQSSANTEITSDVNVDMTIIAELWPVNFHELDWEDKCKSVALAG